METAELLTVAAACPGRAGAPASFRGAVLARLQVRRYRNEEFIQSAIDDAGGIYGVVEGTVRLMLSAVDHGPYCGHLLRPGSWAGEGPAIAGGPRLVSLVACGETAMVWLSRGAISEVAALDGNHWRHFVGLMSSNLDLALGAIADLTLRDHRKRLVAVLLRVAGQRNVDAPAERAVSVPLTQSDLAVMANVTRTTAGRTLRALEASGLITVGYGQVTIAAPARLRKLIEE